MTVRNVGWIGAVAQTYSTVAAAVAASSHDDEIVLHSGVSDAVAPNFNESISTSLRLNWSSGLSGYQKSCLRQLDMTNIPLTTDISITDIHCTLRFYLTSASSSTAEITMDRCSSNTTIRSSLGNGGTLVCKACRVICAGEHGFNSGIVSNTLTCYNCTVIGPAQYGMFVGKVYNCAMVGALDDDVSNLSSGDYNLLGTLNAGYTAGANDTSGLTMAQMGIDDNGRMTLGSTYIAGGFAYTDAPARDYWGNLYGSPPAIGADAGVIIETDGDSTLTTVTGGNWTAATDTLYASGNQYGIGGTSKTGTFSCTAPSQPVLSVVNNDDGTATATIAGSSAGTTNTVYMFADSMTVSPTAVATISVDGAKKFTVSPIGIYWFYALSDLSGLTAISTTIERVDVSDGSDTAENSEDQYIRQYGELFTVQNEVEGRDTNYARTSTWTDSHTAYGWMQPIGLQAGSVLLIQYEKRELKVSHKVWFAEDPLATEGDRIQKADGTSFVIRGVTDQAGINRLWRVDVEELK